MNAITFNALGMKSEMKRFSLVILAIFLLTLTYNSFSAWKGPGQAPDVKPELEAQISAACSQCHKLPSADLLEKREWRDKVNNMFHLANQELLGKYGRPIWELDPPQVSNYFLNQAPHEFEVAPWGPGTVSSKVTFDRHSIPGGATIVERPGVANVQLHDIFEDVPGPELIICDMLSGWVTWVDPDHPQNGLQPIAQLKNPCHSEMVDLDADGRQDLLIAELGDPLPSDAKFGSVALLRRTGPRDFETIRLTPDIGRVADARPADFDKDGDLDVVVAEFGWRKLGSILYLENVSTQPGELKFESKELDPRHGAIHVPVVDLDKDGDLDFIALISQEHETIVAFLNRGNGDFDLEEIYTGPHPHWGSSGIEPVDLDGDGDLDVLATNGDTLDDQKLRSYHGISWLENTGSYPFRFHRIDSYHGVHRAEAGDLDNDGDLDIVACSFLPDLEDAKRQALNLSGLVWYEQTSSGQFSEHPVVEGIRCDFATLDLGDFDGDGRLDVMTGNLMGTPRADGSEPALVEILKQR
jgi:hypothetical protein